MVPPSVTSNPKTAEEEKAGAASAPVHISNWPPPETSANCAKDTVQSAMVTCWHGCGGKGLQDWRGERAGPGHNAEGGLPSERGLLSLAASVPHLLPQSWPESWPGPSLQLGACVLRLASGVLLMNAFYNKSSSYLVKSMTISHCIF